LGEPGADGRIIFNWILKKKGMRLKIRLIYSGYSTMEGPCEHSNKPMGYIKARIFLDQLTDCKVIKDTAPYS
jgi:hypothetical protein